MKKVMATSVVMGVRPQLVISPFLSHSTKYLLACWHSQALALIVAIISLVQGQNANTFVIAALCACGRDWDVAWSFPKAPSPLLLAVIPFCGYFGARERNRNLLNSFVLSNACCAVLFAMVFVLTIAIELPAIVRPHLFQPE